MSSLKITGLREVNAKLRSLADDVRRKVLIQGTAAGAKVIKEEAGRRAPQRTGNLSRNLGTWVSSKNNGEIAEARVKPKKKAYYGRFVELGTRKMRARPFLRPALDASGQAAVDRLAEKLKERVDAV